MSTGGAPVLQSDQDPGTPKERLMQIAALRALHLQQPFRDQPGLPEEEANDEAIRQLKTVIDIGSMRSAFASYVRTGVKNPTIYAFTKEPDPSDPTNPQHYLNKQQGGFLRDWLAEPIARALGFGLASKEDVQVGADIVRSYIGEPLLRIPAAGAQGIVNLGAGVANFFGANVTPPEMESAFFASMRKFAGDPASIQQLRAEEAAALQAYESQRGIGQQIVQGAGTLVGTVAGFRLNPALIAGAKAGGWAATAATNLAKSPAFVQKVATLVGRGAGGFGAVEFLQQPAGEAPRTLGERAEAGLLGVVTGPAYEISGQLGKVAFFKLMRNAGRDGQVLTQVVAKFARENGIARALEDGETKEQFFKRVLDTWIGQGTPGLKGLGINTQKAVALGGQALVEAAGFSAIDAEFRKDLGIAFLEQDAEAWGNVVARYAGNALGMWFVHAGGKLGEIPKLQRRVHDPMRGFNVQALPNEPQQVTSLRELTKLPDKPTPTDPLDLQRAAQQDLFRKNHLWRFGWSPVTVQEKPPQEPVGVAAPGEARPADPVVTDPALLRQRMLTELFRRSHFYRWGWAPAEVKAPPTGTEPTSIPREPTPPPKPEPIESGPVRKFELPDSPYGFEIRGGDIVPNEALREAMGSPVRVNAALFVEKLHKANLVSALHSKAALPGQEVSVDGIKGEGNRLRIIRYGEYLERSATVDSQWQLSGQTTSRGRDQLSPKQQEVVRNLEDTQKRMQETLEPADQSLLGAVVETLRTVASEKDQSVAETLNQMPVLTRDLADQDPTVRSQAVLDMAESLTVKGPEVLKAEREAREEAKKEEEKAAEEQAKAEEQVPHDFYVIVRTPDGTQVGVPTVAQTEALARTEALGKVPGEVVRVEDLSSAPRLGQSEAFGGLIPPEIARAAEEVALGGAKGIAELTGKALDFYEASLFKAVRDSGAAVAEAMGRAADDKSRLLRAENQREGQILYEELTQRPNKELEQFLEDGKGGRTTLLAAKLDEKLGKHFGADKIRLSPEAQEIVDLGHKLIVNLAKVAHREGLGFVNAEGGLTGDPNLWRLPRKLTPEGRYAMRDPASPDRRLVTEWLQEARGMEPREVEAKLQMFDSVSRHDPTEMRRFIDVLPSRLERPDGSHFHLLEDKPRVVSRILNDSATVLGARSVFRDKPVDQEGLTPEQQQAIADVPDGMQRTLVEVSKQHGTEAMLATKRMGRALHGLPINDSQPWTRPGSPADNLMRVVNTVLEASKPGMLSLAFIPNSLALPQHVMHLGPTRMARAIRDFGRDAANLRLAEEANRLAGEGWMVRHVVEKRVKGETGVETFENATRRLGEIVTKPLDVVQGGLNVILAKSGEYALAEMRAGNGGQVDRSTLFSMAFTPEAVDRMVSGRGTKAEYDRYKLNLVSTLEAGRAQTQVDKSVSAQTTWFEKLVWFQNFFRHRVRIMRAYGTEMGAAKGPAEKGLVSAKILGFAMANSVGGFATQIVRKWLKGESFGDWLRETQENPLDAMGTVLMSGLFGAGGGITYESLRGVFGGQTVDEVVGNIADSLGVVGSAIKGGTFLSSMLGVEIPGSGYQGLEPVEKVGKFLRSNVPAARTLHRGLFGVAAIALTDESPVVASAQDALNRWKRQNGIIIRPGGEQDQQEWLNAMRRVMNEVEAGGQWGDVELMDAIEKAGILGRDKDSVAASLRTRKTFKGDLDPKSEAYDAAKDQSLRAYLGEKHANILEEIDQTLEYLAVRWLKTQR